MALLFFVGMTLVMKMSGNGVSYKANLKRMKIALGVTFAAFVFSLTLTSTSDEPEIADTDNQVEAEESKKPIELTDEEKAEVEAKAKEDAEKKAEEARAREKAQAEKKAKEEADAKAAAEEEQRIKEETLSSLKFSGTGDTGTDRFKLESGFVVIDATHSGSRNFILELLDTNGNSVELVVNDIGPYEGSQAFIVPAGEYLYNISADGSWTVEMSQYLPDEKDILNGAASGKGDSAVFINIESGARNIKSTHDGQRNFIVEINDSVLLVNDIGIYEGSQIQQFEDSAIYLFNVIADGNWTINID